MLLQETWNDILEYSSPDGGDPVVFYDASHFANRVLHPRLDDRLRHLMVGPYDAAIATLDAGAFIIDQQYHFEPQLYMVISRSKNVKIPVYIQPNRHPPHEIVGVVPTIMPAEYETDGDDVYPNPVDIFVESFRHVVAIPEFAGQDDFVTFIENGEVIPSFITIYV